MTTLKQLSNGDSVNCGQVVVLHSQCSKEESDGTTSSANDVLIADLLQ